jgi:tetratricopeptide (TPR) repeat protein
LTADGTAAGLDAETYAEVVHLYMDGGFSESVRRLSRAASEDIQQACEDYGQRWLTELEIEAAVLLHTEAAMFESTDFPFHIRSARRWMGHLDPSRRPWLERQWYLILAYYFMGSLDFREARATLEAAIKAFPHDDELRLAYGTLNETWGWTAKDDDRLLVALEQYESILKAKPGLEEARLRHGRVMSLLERHSEAVEELQSVLSRTIDPVLATIAHLTLGDIYKARGDLDESVRAYREAINLSPGCQPAAIALAHGLHDAGKTEDSLEVLSEFMKRDLGDPLEDPWFRYQMGNATELGSLLQSLRLEVRH